MIYDFEYVVRMLSFSFDIVGVIILVAAAIIILFKIFDAEIISKKKNSHKIIRRNFTQHINFALEFFIAGDILRTVIAPDIQGIIKLGAVVAIRIALGFMLLKESE
ncbi:MAG: DUF1622 domain-containing protein [Candidatus Aenigmarchaeota archaeon]|nr:DUF1622 domain-containing protein [Candidatus Aenigmarchaeota archaeon]MDI6722706.1 DUF1622 domain-containing protein [Candidatus Aenigmarchaeota archaeon]